MRFTRFAQAVSLAVLLHAGSGMAAPPAREGGGAGREGNHGGGPAGGRGRGGSSGGASPGGAGIGF